MINSLLCVKKDNIPKIRAISFMIKQYILIHINKEEITQSIQQLLLDNKLRTQLSKASLRRARIFNWNKSAEELVKILEKVL